MCITCMACPGASHVQSIAKTIRLAHLHDWLSQSQRALVCPAV